MHNHSYCIALNFLALTSQEFKFTVYRKPRDEQAYKVETDWYRGSLPIEPDSNGAGQDMRANYWISLKPKDGFEYFCCNCHDNQFLTKYVLHKALETQLASTNLHYVILTKRFERAIRFKVKEYSEGYEVIRLEPYYLSVAKQFGFLIDFEFQKREEVIFTKKFSN